MTTIDVKIKEKELIVKNLITDLKNLLNISYKSYEASPNDYRYLSSLTTSIEKLNELNNSLKEINN